MTVRLNKLLSHLGVASRRVADGLIEQGRIVVNGQIVTELGTKVDPEKDDIRADGRRLKAAPERRYLLLNKPAGVVCTRADPQRRTTVIDLLALAGVKGYFYPVGRLDYDSEGLLILTNDGEFAEKVAHPRYELERTYEAIVEGVPDEHDLERFRRGVTIEGRRTKPAGAKVLRVIERRQGKQAMLELVIREGRNRQVRRMWDAIAHPVDRLRRVRIGPLADRRLGVGHFRDLTPAEIKALTQPVSARPPAPVLATPREATDPNPRTKAHAKPHATPRGRAVRTSSPRSR